MTAGVKARVVELFEKYRTTPGAPYDEGRFLDFLLADTKKKGAVRDSFRGLRVFNAFIDEVQYEFAVCFSIEDREANYSLDEFVSRVIKLQQSRRGSLRSLQGQINAGPGWGVIVIADVVLLMIAYSVGSIPWVLVGVIIVTAAVNIRFAIFAWNARSYLLKLRERIEEN